MGVGCSINSYLRSLRLGGDTKEIPRRGAAPRAWGLRQLWSVLGPGQLSRTDGSNQEAVSPGSLVVKVYVRQPSDTALKVCAGQFDGPMPQAQSPATPLAPASAAGSSAECAAGACRDRIAAQRNEAMCQHRTFVGPRITFEIGP
jgi:hypothetical protein